METTQGMCLRSRFAELCKEFVETVGEVESWDPEQRALVIRMMQEAAVKGMQIAAESLPQQFVIH